MCIKCCCCHICPGGRRRGRPGRAVELELLHCISNTIDASCPPIVTVFLPLEWHSTQTDHTCIIYIYIYLYVHSVTHAHIDLLPLLTAMACYLPPHLHSFIHSCVDSSSPHCPIASSPTRVVHVSVGVGSIWHWELRCQMHIQNTLGDLRRPVICTTGKEELHCTVFGTQGDQSGGCFVP